MKIHTCLVSDPDSEGFSKFFSKSFRLCSVLHAGLKTVSNSHDFFKLRLLEEEPLE